MYKIVETTDGKYTGKVIDKELIKKGNELLFEHFIFEIDNIQETTNYLTLSNANYVIILKNKEMINNGFNN